MQKVLLISIATLLMAGTALYMSQGMNVFADNEDHPSVRINSIKTRSDQAPAPQSVSDDEEHPETPAGQIIVTERKVLETEMTPSTKAEKKTVEWTGTFVCKKFGSVNCFSYQVGSSYWSVNTVETTAATATTNRFCYEYTSSGFNSTNWTKKYHGYNYYYAYFYNGSWYYDGSAQTGWCLSSISCDDGRTYACN